MTVAESIRTAAAQLLQNTGDEALLTLLCEPITAYLTKKLRSGVKPDDCRECFVTAGAILAASAAKRFAARGISSFDAGTLSITLEDKSDENSRFAMELIAPWCGGNVAFRSVRG